MSRVKYYTQWQWPGLLWRVDTELALVEFAQADRLDAWALSNMDMIHVDALIRRKDMEEVSAP